MLGFRQLQNLGQRAGDGGNAAGMLGGEGLFGVDGRGERLHGRVHDLLVLLAGPLLFEGLALQIALNDERHGVDVERLGNKVARAPPQGQTHEIGVAVRRDQDDGQVGIEGLETRGKLQAAHAAEHDIAHDQVEIRAAQQLHRLFGAGNRADLIAAANQDTRQNVAYPSVVVYDQYARGLRDRLRRADRLGWSSYRWRFGQDGVCLRTDER